jgi:hypothetical protein
LIAIILGAMPLKTEAISTNIQFEFVNGLIIIQADIDGTYGNYIFDTGADAIILNDNNKNGKLVHFSSILGELNAYQVRVNEIRVGNLEVHKLDAFISDLSSIENFTNRKIHGILGGNVFIPHSVELNFYTKTIIISDKKVNNFDLGFRKFLEFDTKLGIPVAKIQIGEKTYAFILDSGATCHFISKKIRKNHPDLFFNTGESVNVLTAEEKDEIGYKYFLEQLPLSKGYLNNLKFCAIDFDVFADDQTIKIDGILSLTKLGASKMVLDLDRNIVYF